MGWKNRGIAGLLLLLAGCCPGYREYWLENPPGPGPGFPVRLREGCSLHLDRLQVAAAGGRWTLSGRIHGQGGHRMIPVWQRVKVRALDAEGAELAATVVATLPEGELATRAGVQAVRFEAPVPAPGTFASLEIVRVSGGE